MVVRVLASYKQFAEKPSGIPCLLLAESGRPVFAQIDMKIAGCFEMRMSGSFDANTQSFST